MEILFGSDASIRGPAAIPPTHVYEVCVNYHPRLEFLNESIFEYVIFWNNLTFIIYLAHIAQDSTQRRSSPTYGTPIDEVLVFYV